MAFYIYHLIISYQGTTYTIISILSVEFIRSSLCSVNAEHLAGL